ncbi:hypothetical protein HOE31_00830 [bacterium]|jgi:mRNA interferase RelE/StbE|nr:hypothetical protein [bacterium]MBT4121479.1 hypothetical protein [bacterium]MBT4335275.1 hypothetical protein [bacterium]MBT4495137.1 hypothetical protein [bacterium]MBT4764377.1 hypothetical protein [bacterium]
MDKITKALKKLSIIERNIAINIMSKIENEDLTDLDVKKLRGYNDIYRIKKGKIRVIIRILDDDISLVTLGRRNDKTYNF